MSGTALEANGFMAGSSIQMKVGALCGSTISLGIFITATVYLGIYSYNNPDGEKCWVIKGLEQSTTTRNEAIATANALGLDVPSGYPVEMHKLFLAWFMWGFWSHTGLVVIIALGALINYMV